jgi:hypothetical protein
LTMVKKISPGAPAPVRTIGVRQRSVRGIVPKLGSYESTLERDFMELIRFEAEYKTFVHQPLKIEYPGEKGKKRRYTPDGLIHFKDESIKPLLYEIKYREDFRREWRELMPRFRAAKQYCADMGWRFEVFTEREIRTPYLTNIRFLWRFKDVQINSRDSDVLMGILPTAEKFIINDLLRYATDDDESRAVIIPVLWNLIATRAISCDLDEPLTMTSRVWLNGERK